MIRALQEVWRRRHPRRSSWACSTWVRGRFDDPPGFEAVGEAVDAVLLPWIDDDLDRLNYRSQWDVAKGTFRLEVVAHDPTVLDEAIRRLRHDPVLAACDLDVEVRWSPGA